MQLLKRIELRLPGGNLSAFFLTSMSNQSSSTCIQLCDYAKVVLCQYVQALTHILSPDQVKVTKVARSG